MRLYFFFKFNFNKIFNSNIKSNLNEIINFISINNDISIQYFNEYATSFIYIINILTSFITTF